ncbi:MAG: virulence RhuM family protein, partial [Flavobacteriales bacterium]|nr:virulence RhuM family protein [Flavobacteriales bacterium]
MLKLKKVSEIIIYKSVDNQIEVNVQAEGDTVWLTQQQLVNLFQSSKANISEHIKHIFESKELEEQATVRNFRTVQKEGKREVERNRLHYNLDLIISVGYRVNSKQGVQFRIWANKILKEYLVKGYALNEKKLKETQQQFIELQQSIKLLENVVNQKQLNSDEATSLLKVITEYSHALSLLDQYDHQKLSIQKKIDEDINKLTYDEAIKQIILWRDSHD